jgi:hypothetical protein
MLLSQNSRSAPRATTRLWLQSRQEDLYVSDPTFTKYVSRC